MISMHAIGMGIVVGIFLMLDLRLLRVIRGVSFGAFLTLFPLAWIGLAINTLSGSSMFTSQATTFVESTPFLIKISAVISGVVVGIFIQRRLKMRAADWDISDSNIESSASVLAVLSLVCWIGAIFAGRLIAYL
jgi:hypothetical protein